MNTERLRRCGAGELEPRSRYCSLDDGGGNSSSSSSSSSNTTTNNIDRRIAAAPSSIAISGDSSSANVTITSTSIDAGAVHDAFGFAADAFQHAVDFAVGSQNKANAVVASALGATVDSVNASEKQIADAYTTAKAGEQKVLVGVGLVIAGIVAVVAVRGLSHD